MVIKDIRNTMGIIIEALIFTRKQLTFPFLHNILPILATGSSTNLLKINAANMDNIILNAIATDISAWRSKLPGAIITGTCNNKSYMKFCQVTMVFYSVKI